MVRIKYTGPPTAVRPQHAQSRGGLPTNGTTPMSSPPVETQAAQDSLAKLSPGEIRALQQQQSLEMVKIMLHVSFGTLFYLREFLPLQCFDDRDLKLAQKQDKFSYREFIENSSYQNGFSGVSENASGKPKRSQPLKIILRGSEPKADMLLNVLETGIFDALSKSVLEAVQLTIIADKEVPENVLESYTFTFRYTEGIKDVNKRLESLSVQPVGYVADMKSAHTARVGLESIVRRLITLSSFLPSLPNKRTLGVHLFYTDDCPLDYEPPGFSSGKDDLINYPRTESWIRESQACGKMESGWHTVGLKVTSLRWIGPEPLASEPLPQIPAGIEYNDAVPRGEDIGFKDEMLQASQIEVRSSEEATQDAAERERLQLMMPSQEVHSSDLDLTSTQPAKRLPTLGSESAERTRPAQKFILRKEKIAEMRNNTKQQETNGLKEWKSQEPAPVRCLCEWKGEEKEMLACSFCHTRQHRLCYGYLGAFKDSVPDIHACYRCLLEPKESKTLESLKNIVLGRRALSVILAEGVPNTMAAWSEKTHCTPPASSRVKEFLKRKAVLHPTPGLKPKESARKGLPAFFIPNQTEVHRVIQEEIMHPMVKIQHHYTTKHVPGSIEAFSPPSTSEAGGLSQPPINPIIPIRGNEQRDQGLQASETQPKHTDTLQHTQVSSFQRQTRERSSTGVVGNDALTETNLLTPQPANNSTRKRTRSSHIGPEPVPVTPSQSTTDLEQDSGGPRRSGRKRRKISNYTKLIDVGADTSGNENE
ncbi:HORMA domain-containing protein [Aspergillus unguis]